MTIRIETPPQEVRITILVIKTIKPPSPTTQRRVTMTISSTALPTARNNFDSTIAEIDLSSINKTIIENQRLNNADLVLIT